MCVLVAKSLLRKSIIMTMITFVHWKTLNLWGKGCKSRKASTFTQRSKRFIKSFSKFWWTNMAMVLIIETCLHMKTCAHSCRTILEIKSYRLGGKRELERPWKRDWIKKRESRWSSMLRRRRNRPSWRWRRRGRRNWRSWRSSRTSRMQIRWLCSKNQVIVRRQQLQKQHLLFPNRLQHLLEQLLLKSNPAAQLAKLHLPKRHPIKKQQVPKRKNQLYPQKNKNSWMKKYAKSSQILSLRNMSIKRENQPKMKSALLECL